MQFSIKLHTLFSFFFQEIKEHQESDFSFDESSWTEDDLKLLTPACGLIKTTYSICKKLKESIHRSGHLDTKERVDQIDQTAMAVQTLSPSIDDLVTSLYPPLVKKQVYTSVSICNSLLSTFDSMPILPIDSPLDTNNQSKNACS